MNHIFCVAHKEITYQLPENTTLIWTGSGPVQCDQPIKNSYRLSEISHELEFYYPYLSGAAGSFAILELFLNKKLDISIDDDCITVMQYRKFLHPQALGEPSSSYLGMRILRNTDGTKPAPFEGVALPALLMSRPKPIGNIYRQYYHSHKAPDILRYTAAAIDLGVLTPEDSFNFLNFDIIIPGGAEFGTYPAYLFLKIMSKLEDICIHFIKHCQLTDLSPYHRRALAFCNERMGSYLLMKYLSEAGIHVEDDMVGEMCCALTNDATDYWAGL